MATKPCSRCNQNQIPETASACLACVGKSKPERIAALTAEIGDFPILPADAFELPPS